MINLIAVSFLASFAVSAGLRRLRHKDPPPVGTNDFDAAYLELRRTMPPEKFRRFEHSLEVIGDFLGRHPCQDEAREFSELMEDAITGRGDPLAVCARLSELAAEEEVVFLGTNDFLAILDEQQTAAQQRFRV